MNTDIVITLLAVLQISVLIFGGFKFFITLTTRLEKLEEQYKPNGGSSMRDAVNRIELKVSKLEGQFEQHMKENN